VDVQNSFCTPGFELFVAGRSGNAAVEDCTSAVVVPGVMDYTDLADDAFRRFANAGMHVVRSTDPVTSWPGLSIR
jgi:nicotinamidase-related amidase